MARTSVNVPTAATTKVVGRQPVLFPPPRDPRSPKDTGLMPRTGLGRDAGFLPKFQTAEAMEEAIETYFKYCEETDRPPTMAGLTIALGFKSVQTLKNYEERGEDFHTLISVARTVIEEWLSIALIRAEKSPNGIIFALKNMHGWADKIEQTTTHQVGDSLAELLVSLQGTVLRPKAIEAREVVDAEFTEVLNPLHRSLGAMDEVIAEYETKQSDSDDGIPDEFRDLL